MGVIKRCVACNTEFEAKRITALYCSDVCRKKGSRGVVSSSPREEGPSTPIDNLQASMPEMDTSWIEDINNQFAAKGLPLLSDEPEVIHFIHTGIPELDSLTKEFDPEGIGGFPRKRITEAFGPNRSGKSSLVKIIAKNNPDLRIVFFDAEGGFIAPPPNVLVIKENVVEVIGPQIVELLDSGQVDLIVVDSVASLVTQKQYDNDPEGNAAMARALNPEIKRIVAHAIPRENGLPTKDKGTALLFINQLRSTVQAFGTREYTTGGNSLPYFASLRLEFRSASADKVIKNGVVVGQNVRVTVKKSRFGPIDTLIKYKMIYGDFQDFDEQYKGKIHELL